MREFPFEVGQTWAFQVNLDNPKFLIGTIVECLGSGLLLNNVATGVSFRDSRKSPTYRGVRRGLEYPDGTFIAFKIIRMAELFQENSDV